MISIQFVNASSVFIPENIDEIPRVYRKFTDFWESHKKPLTSLAAIAKDSMLFSSAEVQKCKKH